MKEGLEQSYCITFCQKLGNSQVETIRKIQIAFSVITVDVFHITETKESLPSAQQCQSDAAFFDSCGIVHHEYAPQGQTITKECYRDLLCCLHDVVRRKRPELWSTGNWRLHHDNAPAHSSHLIQTPVVRQAPYSPDMVPCDF